MDLHETIKQTPFFESLDPHELEAVARCVVESSFAAGDQVIEEGTPGECLYMVKSGKLKVEKKSKGKTLQLAELGPGAAFGEMSQLDTVPTSATVTAVEGSSLLEISRMDLNVLLNWDTILAAKMWRSFTLLLSERLRDMNDRMLDRYGADALN